MSVFNVLGQKVDNKPAFTHSRLAENVEAVAALHIADGDCLPGSNIATDGGRHSLKATS